MATYIYIYLGLKNVYIYLGFKTLFYVVWHLESIASYLPIGLHLGFFRSWPSLYLPSSFSSVFLVLSFVLASTSVLFWVILLLPFSERGHTMLAGYVQFLLQLFPLVQFVVSWLLFNSFFSWYSWRSPQGIHLCSFDPSLYYFLWVSMFQNHTINCF